MQFVLLLRKDVQRAYSSFSHNLSINHLHARIQIVMSEGSKFDNLSFDS